MRTFLFLLALFASISSALAQSRQPANPSTLPTTSPQEFDLLDKTGAWARFAAIDTAAHAVVGPGNVYNAVLYGADPTGVNDSCPAMLKILGDHGSNLPALGASLKFPAGKYRFLSNCLDVTNKPIAYLGDGAGVTWFYFTTTSAGITVSNTSNRYPIIFKDLQILTAVVQPTNAAIYVNVDISLRNAGGPGAIFEDLMIGNWGNTTTYWRYGIHCNGCNNAFAKNVKIWGMSVITPTGVDAANNMKAGFLVTGESQAFAKFYDYVELADVGEEAAGDVEGAPEFGNQFIGVNYGWIYHSGSYGDPTSGADYPGPEIVNCNVAAWKAAYQQFGWAVTVITGSTIWRRNDNVQTYVAIGLYDGVFGGTTVGSVKNLITTNSIVGWNSGDTSTIQNTGISFGPNSVNNIVHDNFFKDFHRVFTFADGLAGPEYISGNTAIGLPEMNPQAWSSAGFANCPVIVWEDNQPVLYGTTTTDAALPNNQGPLNAQTPCITPGVAEGVRGVQGQRNFFTNNTSAATVVDIQGGYYGKEITITGNDGGLTTIASNAVIALRPGSGNVVLGNNQTLTLRRMGPTTGAYAWREMARNF